MVKYIGADLAEKFATAHEAVDGNPKTRKEMDLLNNKEGRNIGNNSKTEMDKIIADKVYEAVKNGKMWEMVDNDVENGKLVPTKIPTISITSPTNNQKFTTSTVTVSGTTSFNGLKKVEVKVGSGTWQSATGTTSWSKSVTLASGSNTIYARATDTSGNTKEISVAVTYNVADTTKPTISISSPTNNQKFTTASVTVSGTASDNVALSKVEVKVGSGTWQSATGTTSWSKSVTLASGSNTIYARATDTSGNTKEISVAVTYNKK